MSKIYYTPSIEEFHIGFVYQVKWNNEGGDAWAGNPKDFMSKEAYEIYDKEGFLSKTMCPADFDRLFVRRSLAELRVKILDRADIEELGFKPYFTHEVKAKLNTNVLKKYEVYKYKEFYIQFETLQKITTISTLDIEVKDPREYMRRVGESELLFNGVLLNYNELKNVLKNVGLHVDNSLIKDTA